jgi:ribonuclease HI
VQEKPRASKVRVEHDYLIFCDGGCTANPGDLAVAAVVCVPEPECEIVIEQARRAGHGTSNVAEYRALAHGIGLARLMGARRPLFCVDSALVAQQVNGWWAMRGSSELHREHARCASALMEFDRWVVKHVPRERNRRADWLVSGLLGHSRTLKKAPGVDPVATEGPGRPGWSQL